MMNSASLSKANLAVGCFLGMFLGAILSLDNYSVGGLTLISSGSPAAFDTPNGLFYDANGEKLLIAEAGSTKKISMVQNGMKTFIAGSGGAYVAQAADAVVAATSASFNSPMGIWGDSVGNVFVSDQTANRVFKISPTGESSVLAGTGVAASNGNGGPATSAAINRPMLITGDKFGNIYIPEFSSHVIRKVNVASGTISALIGTAGVWGSGGDSWSAPATSATTWNPYGVAVHFNGDVSWSAQGNENRLRVMRASDNRLQGLCGVTIGNGGSSIQSTGTTCMSSMINGPYGVWADNIGNTYVVEYGDRLAHAGYLGGNILLVEKEKNSQQKAYRINQNRAASPKPIGIAGDGFGNFFVSSQDGTVFAYNNITGLPTQLPTARPSSVAPSSTPVPSVKPSRQPSVVPTSATPTTSPTLAPPEYSVTVSAKSFKYFEVRAFTEANERVYPASYNLVDCPENANAVVWGQDITEDTNTCVYGLPRHYWCECPAASNGNKPKLILNFGGIVFDRLELLILDWEDGEVVVSDSANNMVLFSATRPGGPVVEEEFVRYDHLNLLQIAPSVVPTVTPSSIPTIKPSWTPTTKPSIPSIVPTQTPTVVPTTTAPSAEPSVTPSAVPSAAPSFTAQYTITLTAKTFKYFEVRVYTHDNLRIFPVSYELEHCPENAGVTVWNDQTTEDTNTCVYGYPRNFWCQCVAVADAKPKLVLHMGHTVFDRVELLLLNWEDGEVTVMDEANHETFLSATHDGVGNEFVTYGNLNLQHAASPARKLLRGSVADVA